MSAETGALVLDGVLALTVVVLGWRCALARDRFECVALFIGLGLVMAIAWTRLRAPDLALAEAALGAGLTGAMLIAAWADLRHLRATGVDAPAGAAAVLAVALMALLVIAVAPLLTPPAGTATGLAAEVAARIGETGVRHPVTAVLVDFRAFDTLLELAVLMTALTATWQLGDAQPMLRGRLRGPVFVAYVRVVIPLLVILGGALLWRGASLPGGAFQAGAVLAAAGVAALLASPAGQLPSLVMAYRVVVSLGVAAFLGLGLAMLAVSGRFLDWPPSSAGALVLTAEAAATLSIALTLALLVLGGRPGNSGTTPAQGRAEGSP